MQGQCPGSGCEVGRVNRCRGAWRVREEDIHARRRRAASGDHDVQRVDENRAAGTGSGTDIEGRVEKQGAGARDLDEAAIARAVGQQRARDGCRLGAPDHDLSAVARWRGDIDAGSLGDQNTAGTGQGRAVRGMRDRGSGPVATDEDLATRAWSARAQAGRFAQGDGVTRDGQRRAITARAERSIDLHNPGVTATYDDDAATVLGAGRLDGATDRDHLIANRSGVRGGDQDRPALGGDGAAVDDPRPDCVVDGDACQTVSVEVHGQARPRTQHHIRALGRDRAVVRDHRGDQHDVPVAGCNGPGIRHGGPEAGSGQRDLSCEDIVVRDLRRTGQQPVHVDGGAPGDRDTGRVQHPDIAVGRQLSGDARRQVGPRDAVDRERLSRRLLEAHGLARVDVEGCVIQNCGRCGLVEHGGLTGLLDRHGPGGHGGALRPRLNSRAHTQCHCRAAEQCGFQPACDRLGPVDVVALTGRHSIPPRDALRTVC